MTPLITCARRRDPVWLRALAAPASDGPIQWSKCTPVFGAAAIASCPVCLSFSATFDPIRPVPPITTIFMTSAPWRTRPYGPAIYASREYADAGGVGQH
jgi:hypothetical protein